jgi:hypothetical protein
MRPAMRASPACRFAVSAGIAAIRCPQMSLLAFMKAYARSVRTRPKSADNGIAISAHSVEALYNKVLTLISHAECSIEAYEAQQIFVSGRRSRRVRGNGSSDARWAP